MIQKPYWEVHQHETKFFKIQGNNIIQFNYDVDDGSLRDGTSTDDGLSKSKRILDWEKRNSYIKDNSKLDVHEYKDLVGIAKQKSYTINEGVQHTKPLNSSRDADRLIDKMKKLIYQMYQ